MIMVNDNQKFSNCEYKSAISVRDFASEHVSQYVYQGDPS